MFERLQRPFLTVETGEAYQPIRLTYSPSSEQALIAKLNQLACLTKDPTRLAWDWYWRNECQEVTFESLDTFDKKNKAALRLGTLTLREGKLYINLPSFKRACLAVAFFDKHLDKHLCKIDYADFVNKVFGIDEQLPHGFAELFDEVELDALVRQRLHDYDSVQHACEHASDAEEALTLLTDYTDAEAKKRLPYAERYTFAASNEDTDPDVTFLGFYIFLRSRELVAIRRWFGQTGYSLANAAEETMSQVFGDMNIDIIE